MHRFFCVQFQPVSVPYWILALCLGPSMSVSEVRAGSARSADVLVLYRPWTCRSITIAATWSVSVLSVLWRLERCQLCHFDCILIFNRKSHAHTFTAVAVSLSTQYIDTYGTQVYNNFMWRKVCVSSSCLYYQSNRQHNSSLQLFCLTEPLH